MARPLNRHLKQRFKSRASFSEAERDPGIVQEPPNGRRACYLINLRRQSWQLKTDGISYIYKEKVPS